MFSTIALVKNSKLDGRLVGTHQQIDQAARKVLGKQLPRGRYFPSAKEIIHFEGTRGPDGLKRKSPGEDEPSHMLIDQPSIESSVGQAASDQSSAEQALRGLLSVNQPLMIDATPSGDQGHERLDERSVMTMILDHRWNLIRALNSGDHVRAAFEAAWMAHMITDGLTPAHHFPLLEVKDELMTDKELVRVFGQPIKGMIHGRNMLETLRNNWLYWGAKGHMSQHIAYEYGVIMIAAALPKKAWLPQIDPSEFQPTDFESSFARSLKLIQGHQMYDRFRADGWTTDLAIETRDILLPEIVKCVALGWYSAAAEAYHLPQNRKRKGAA